ncbi:MAG TPA: glutamyl-tRNA reductase [Candidatus Hydrogenedentes bacterium]|nr:glutamyl-tRNA reductase [Candidatus Hydrogenedentota bacterium]HPG67468.1 glutamyl-tRNA reductase [Candidatus Hydrogenedentota bacterium]
MSLVVVGLNHRTSPLALRERLAISADRVPEVLSNLARRHEGAGVVLLSTCNRVEVYMSHPLPADELDADIRAFLSGWFGIEAADLADALYIHADRDAVSHLFRVASSLDSLVVGEVQILGQVHSAYLMAQAEQTADKVIHALFQRAFTVAKRVRTQTTVGAGKVSVSSVAVDLAESIFSALAGKTVVVVGSGDVADLTLKSLVERGVRGVLVANRHPERAQRLAEVYEGEAVPFDDLRNHLHRADIVISTTAAPRTVLHAPDFEEALKRRGQEPMLVIDIAVPRDVDSDVGDLDNVYLYNIDDLEQVVVQNSEARRREIDTATDLVETGVDRFMEWLAGLAAEPTIVSMSDELELIRAHELRKTLDALPNLTEDQRREIDYLTTRIVRRILQRPATSIKHEIGHHDPHTVLHLVKRLFGLEDVP